jgi:hypothetical protein
VFKGYGEIARRWLFRPNFSPVHPPSLGPSNKPLDDGCSDSSRALAEFDPILTALSSCPASPVRDTLWPR